MIAPWLLGFLIFTAGPMLGSIYLSLTRYEILTPPVFIGLKNYADTFKDELFQKSLYNTLYYVVFYVPLHLVLALIAALALNVKIRGLGVYRTVYYLPAIVPSVASVLLWMWIFNPDFGLLNAFLGIFGVPPRAWLFDSDSAKPALIIMALWALGAHMIIFIAGLQGVPEAIYEAANIDGCNWWGRFRFVTMPLITPVIFFNMVVSIIGSFQVFNAAFIATNGGPANATLFYVLYLYRNGFQFFKMGYAATLAWILFVIIVIFTVIQFRLSNRWVYYEADARRG